MKAQQVGFKSLVDDAYAGRLRLPEFQRDWKWTRAKVFRLYDSVRKEYPIGGFLTLKASDKLYLSPRLFEGVEEQRDAFDAYVLDGQQRITAGVALFYGTAKSHYFLDLGSLWSTANDVGLDFDDREALKGFADDLDEEDKYVKARRASGSPENLLDSDLLWTPALTDDFKFSIAKERYLRLHPDRAKFLERLIWPFFKVGSEPIVPVTELDSAMPVEAITRVFQTLNTSGQPLTPVEIVTAILFAQGIHLRQEVQEFRELTDYYHSMDSTGEVFLQAVALLDGKNPKKTTLPKTITHVNYSKHKNDAVINCLDRAGAFLSARLGMGLDSTNRLVPYDSMLAPLGIALFEIENRFPQPSPEKAQWHRNLERWFAGSVIEMRYRESQPATQQRDTRELGEWIANGEESDPGWLSDVRIPSLDRVTPSSAIGKLIACLINRRNPKDPLNEEEVGETGAAIVASQSHHIFPRGFCEQHIPDWNPNVDSYNLALNVMPLSKETNRKWNKMNPSDQVEDVRNQWGSEVSDKYELFFVDDRCIEIMERPNKTRDDYLAFIEQRGKVVQAHIAQTWGFVPVDQEPEEDDEDE